MAPLGIQRMPGIHSRGTTKKNVYRACVQVEDKCLLRVCGHTKVLGMVVAIRTKWSRSWTPAGRKLREYLDDHRRTRCTLVPDPGEGPHRTSYRLNPRVLYEGRQNARARSNAAYLRRIIATYHLAANSAPQVVLRVSAAAPAARPTTSSEDLALAARLRSTERATLDPYEFNRLSQKHGWGIIAQARSNYYAEGGEVVREDGGMVLQRWSLL
jgi:hypothetical protein